MVERRDEILAVVALGVVTALLAAQGVLVAVVVVAPLTSAVYELASEDADLDSALELQRPEGRPWWLLSLAMVAVSGAVAVWAQVRLQRGTSVRGRWLWVLVLAGVSGVWGVFTWRMLTTLAP